MTNNPIKIRLTLERACRCPINLDALPEMEAQILERHQKLRDVNISFTAAGLEKIEFATDLPVKDIEEIVKPVYSVYQIPPPPSQKQLEAIEAICPTHSPF